MPVTECPICRRTVTYVKLDEVPFRPFCSQRCQLLDLGRWLNEDYRVSEEFNDPSRVHDDLSALDPDLDE